MTNTKAFSPPGTLVKAIEVCWLIAAGLVPLAIAPESWITGFVQVPKVFVLRSVALVLGVLLVAEAAQRHRDWPERDKPAGEQISRPWNAAIAFLRAQPIVAAGLGVLLATIVATLLSPMRNVSTFGRDAGWDGYALLSTASYVVVFLAVALHLRTAAQVRRLLWTLTASSIILSIYGAGQLLGIDGFRNDSSTERVSLTFGNPIFGGAYLIMTIPLSLALWLMVRERFGRWAQAGLGVGLITPQVFAVLATVSRGPALSLVIGLTVFLGIGVWLSGPRLAAKLAGGAAGVLVLILALSFTLPNGDDARSRIANRLSTIPREIGALVDGDSQRFYIWQGSLLAFTQVKWIDTDAYPDMPDPGNALTRRLFGYGPDLFPYAHNLQADNRIPTPVEHAHNIGLHTLVEMGLVGVLAYAALIGAVSWALVRLLLMGKRGQIPLWLTWPAVGLASVLVARLAEQYVGKGQIADMSLSWLLAGVTVAIGVIAQRRETVYSVPSGGAARVSRRSSNARRSARTSASSVTPIRGTIYGLLALLTVIVWVQAVWEPVRTSWLSGRALTASEEGRGADSTRLLEAAITNEPTAAGVASLFARGLLLQAQSAADHRSQVELVTSAESLLAGPLSRDPMDYRTREMLTDVRRVLVLLEDKPWSYPIQATGVEISLRPNNVRRFVDLANLYIDAGLLEEATAALDEVEGRTEPRRAPTADQLRSMSSVRDTIAAQIERRDNPEGTDE